MATDAGGLFASSGFLQLAPNHCHCSSIRQANRKTRPPIIITAITWAWARITRLDLPLPPLCLPHSFRAQDQLPWRDGDRDCHWRMHKPAPPHSACSCLHIESFLIKSSSGMDRMITPSKPHSPWLTTHGAHMIPAYTQNGNLGKMGPTPLFFPPKVCCQRTASNRPPYHHTDPPTQPAQPQQHNTWTHSRSCWTSQHPCRLVPPPEETSGIIGRLEEVYIYGS